ncbi:hypothetical protein [Niabella drilacis]|uniref:Lipocalin-like domain-containing protein n=1 Tax=Niabella drilacis (strain DSM 25811 / CCM 8410 / CCUG 62505 / LMG 26954 / E90) TaxID=1285928 RepID=A0A1G6L763_NIADE|nr:hypothetical protein [Niabella drilacis]SDC39169.1 hypothetical protein SAMN04487894_102246 [Niabella drilacis]
MNFKKRLFVTLGFVLMAAAISCKKDPVASHDALTNSTWQGTFVVKNNGPDPLAIQFSENKKATLFFGDLTASAEHQGKGSYTLSNNKLFFSVTDYYNEKMSFTGTLTNNTITGTWGHGDADSGGGSFSITKQ